MDSVDVQIPDDADNFDELFTDDERTGRETAVSSSDQPRERTRSPPGQRLTAAAFAAVNHKT